MKQLSWRRRFAACLALCQALSLAAHLGCAGPLKQLATDSRDAKLAAKAAADPFPNASEAGLGTHDGEAK